MSRASTPLPQTTIGIDSAIAEDHEHASRPRRRRPPPSTLSRLMTTSATMMIQIASSSDVPWRTCAVAAALGLAHQLDRDPDQHEPARPPARAECPSRNVMMRDEQEPEADRADRAPDPAEELLARGQRADGEGDDEGVVAGEGEIDQDDLKPAFAAELEVHVPLLGDWLRERPQRGRGGRQATRARCRRRRCAVSAGSAKNRTATAVITAAIGRVEEDRRASPGT